MAGSVKFATDAEILAALSLPFGLAYQACALGTSLSRARSVRDANKAQILTSRVEVYKQTVTQIAFHLELIDKLDSLNTWFNKQYGDSHGKN